MAKGSSPTPGPQQTTTVVNPKQDKLVKLAMPFAKEFAASNPTMPDFPLVAGFDPLQMQGQETVLGAVGAQGDIVGAAGTGNQFLSSGQVLYPGSNPALQATIDASTRPIIQNLLEAVLPGIRNNAVATGNFGSSRQGVAEGLATGRAAQAVGDTAAKVATTGYNSGLDAMVKGQQLAPTIAGSQAIPGMTQSSVGDVRQALAQAMLGEQAQRHNFDQTFPLMMARELMSLAQGVPGGTTISQASVPQQDPTMQYIGMGMQALPLLMTMMSDRNMKEDIVEVGKLKNGLPIYVFTYKLDITRTRRLGLMAQDVEQVIPDAVVKRNGVLFVNYRRVFEELEAA